jgi:hypothetical protein
VLRQTTRLSVDAGDHLSVLLAEHRALDRDDLDGQRHG